MGSRRSSQTPEPLCETALQVDKDLEKLLLLIHLDSTEPVLLVLLPPPPPPPPPPALRLKFELVYLLVGLRFGCFHADERLPVAELGIIRKEHHRSWF